MRPTFLALVLALAACGSPDRQDARTTNTARTAPSPRGPDNLVLRIPRTGGSARVYAYPRLDTVLWSVRGAPAPVRVLAFDDEAGRVAYVDAKGLPTRVDFRQSSTYNADKTKLTAISSADGTEIYAIAADGRVQRFAPTGTWEWKPPVTARALFPQPDGTLLVLGERDGASVVWRVRPPSTEVSDSVVLPTVDRTLRTQVGDRLYLASGDHLTGLLTRTMKRSADIVFDSPIELLDATPSGDRVFVVTRTGTAIEVVDRYRERIGEKIDIGRNVSELRMDPLGRYLLVRPERTDSAIVVALGNNKIIGTVATEWRSDLPFVASDGAIATAQGADVRIVNGESLQTIARVVRGAADFWYPFRWTGFRPRDAKLDQPVEFAAPEIDSAALGDSGAVEDSTEEVAPEPASPARDSTPRRSRGFTVSFAAFPIAEPARALAATIHVNGESARVATAMNSGTTIYRVVLGPYTTREDAERVGRDSKQSYWVYEGAP